MNLRGTRDPAPLRSKQKRSFGALPPTRRKFLRAIAKHYPNAPESELRAAFKHGGALPNEIEAWFRPHLDEGDDDDE